MNNKIKNALGSGLLKHTATLLGGSVGGQILLLLNYFLIARWFGPEPSGAIKIFTAISLTMSLMVNGGYELAIMLPQSIDKVKKLIKRAFQINTIASATFILFTILFREQLSDWLNVPELNGLFWLLGVSIFLEGSITVLHNFLVRKQSYKFVASSLMAYALTFTLVIISLSWGSFNTSSLFYAYVSAQIVKLSLYLYKSLKLGLSIKANQNVTIAEFNDYPTYHLASSVSNYASREMVIPLLGSLFGSASSGLYGMAVQILNLPMRFLLQAFPQVFYQRIAKMQSESNQLVRSETLKGLMLLMFMSLIPTLLLAFFGPQLFSVLLGKEWHLAGTYIKYLVPFAVVSSITSPLTSIINVKFKLKQFFVFNVCLLISRLSAIYVGSLWGDAETAIMLYGVVAFLGALTLLIWLLMLTDVFKYKK